MIKKNYIIGAIGFLILLVGYFVVRGSRDDVNSDIMANVKRGQFRVEIETTGELEAKNSVKIRRKVNGVRIV